MPSSPFSFITPIQSPSSQHGKAKRGHPFVSFLLSPIHFFLNSRFWTSQSSTPATAARLCGQFSPPSFRSVLLLSLSLFSSSFSFVFCVAVCVFRPRGSYNRRLLLLKAQTGEVRAATETRLSAKLFFAFLSRKLVSNFSLVNIPQQRFDKAFLSHCPSSVRALSAFLSRYFYPYPILPLIYTHLVWARPRLYGYRLKRGCASYFTFFFVAVPLIW